MPVNANLLLEASSLNPSSIIDLFQLDLGLVNGPILYFHAGNQKTSNVDIRYKGQDYAAWPVQTDGLQWTTTGTQPRPTVTFSNVLGTFTQLNLQYTGLVGCKVTRTRTFARFLDGQPGADGAAHFPAESWVINRKTNETRTVCTYELANPMDFEDLQLPRRRILADLCQWDYRGSGCGYAGFNVADETDTPLPYAQFRAFYGAWNPNQAYYYGSLVYVPYPVAQQFFVAIYPSGPGYGPPQQPPLIGSSNFWIRDQCSLRLSGCKFRFGNNANLPFGGFPGTRETPITPTGGTPGT